VFVGDIGPDVTLDDLREAFQDEEMSVVEARIVMDQASNRTKGYGFVTFRDSEAARKALSKNGEILKGRKMRVNWATTTKDSKTPIQPQGVPVELYTPPVRNDVQNALAHLAALELMEPHWFLSLPHEAQVGIVRVSSETNGAGKVIWVGNLDKLTTRISIYFQN
jgi:RNA recognition motif. (a.k.a. RRM, RBD, or RNP domain)